MLEPAPRHLGVEPVQPNRVVAEAGVVAVRRCHGVHHASPEEVPPRRGWTHLPVAGVLGRATALRAAAAITNIGIVFVCTHLPRIELLADEGVHVVPCLHVLRHGDAANGLRPYPVLQAQSRLKFPAP